MMKEINCNIIRDILPLYVDEVVSEDTKKLVSEHLEGCPGCRQELEQLRKPVAIPVEREAGPLKRFKKKWKQARFRTALISIFCTVVILAFMWYTRPQGFLEVINTEDSTFISITFPEMNFQESHLDTWTLDISPDDETYTALFSLLKQGTAKASLRNLLGPRSEISTSGSADVINFNFTVSEEEAVFISLFSNGTFWISHYGGNGTLTYTQTNDQLFDALACFIREYGTTLK